MGKKMITDKNINFLSQYGSDAILNHLITHPHVQWYYLDRNQHLSDDHIQKYSDNIDKIKKDQNDH